MGDDMNIQQQLDEVNEELDEELTRWQKNDISPLQLNVDGFKIAHQVGVLTQILIEKGVTTQEEMNLKFKRAALEDLKQKRPVLMRNKTQAKIVEGVQQSQPDIRRVLGLDGKPINPEQN